MKTYKSHIIATIAFCLMTKIAICDVQYHEVIQRFSFVISTTQIYSTEKKIGIAHNLDSSEFKVSYLMLEGNLCATCLCLGLPFPEGSIPSERVNQLRQDASTDNFYFLSIILAKDYSDQPYFGIDYIEKLDVSQSDKIDSLLTRKFNTNDWDTSIRLSHQTLDTLTSQKFRTRMLEKHKKPVEPIIPLKFATGVSALNVFYRGVWSPLQVAVPNVPIENTFITVSNAQIKGQLGKYEVLPGSNHECDVSVYIVNGLDTSFVGKHEYRVKNVPDPKPYVAGKTGETTVRLIDLLASNGLVAKMENFEYDLRFDVSSFKVKITQSNMTKEFVNIGPRFSDGIKAAIRDMTSTDTIEINEILLVDPAGLERTINPIKLTIK